MSHIPSTDFSGTAYLHPPPEGTYQTSKIFGKSIVITGAASGLGEAFLREYVRHGAFVTFGNRSVDKGMQLVKELGDDKVAFVQCDVLSWENQVKLFKTALKRAPGGQIDIVVANAGISGHDDVAEDQVTPDGEPKEPDLSILNINLIGVTYTAKLALHYLARQHEGPSSDKSLILVSSLAGYLDKPNSPQYNASKWGVRGLMRSLRTTMPKQNMRVNLLAPWFIRAPIRTAQTEQHIRDSGVAFADMGDAVQAMMHLSCDLSLNGRAVCVIPRDEHGYGYVDLQQDDHRPDDPMTYWQTLANKI